MRNGYYQIQAYVWIHPNGDIVLRQSATCDLTAVGKWEHDAPFLKILDGEGTHYFRMVSVPVRREFGHRLFLESIASPWEFIIDDTGHEC